MEGTYNYRKVIEAIKNRIGQVRNRGDGEVVQKREKEIIEVLNYRL